MTTSTPDPVLVLEVSEDMLPYVAGPLIEVLTKVEQEATDADEEIKSLENQIDQIRRQISTLVRDKARLESVAQSGRDAKAKIEASGVDVEALAKLMKK